MRAFPEVEAELLSVGEFILTKRLVRQPDRRRTLPPPKIRWTMLPEGSS